MPQIFLIFAKRYFNRFCVFMSSSCSPYRSRCWCFTIYKWDMDDQQALRDIRCSYLVWQVRVGHNNTTCIIGYLEFTESVGFRSLKSRLPHAHISILKISRRRAREYCMREEGRSLLFNDVPHERGEWVEPVEQSS